MDIDAALASLPVEFRTAVVLRDVCDLPYDEIAVILGVPVGTVRSRIARARSALAATWQAQDARRDAPRRHRRRRRRPVFPGTTPVPRSSEQQRRRGLGSAAPQSQEEEHTQ